MRQRDAFGLSLVSEGIDLQTDCRSSRAFQQYILQLLETELRVAAPTKGKTNDKIGTNRGTEITEALHLTAERLHRRSMVVIFTDALVKPSDRDRQDD